MTIVLALVCPVLSLPRNTYLSSVCLFWPCELQELTLPSRAGSADTQPLQFWILGLITSYGCCCISCIANMHLVLALIASFCRGIMALPALDTFAVSRDVDSSQVCPEILPPLPGFDYPHLMIPISSSHPDIAYPNTLTPNITANDVSVIFNFDVPEERAGQMCTWQFLFPQQNQLSTSYFKLIGFGTFHFSLSALGNGAIADTTTFNNQPLQANPHGFPCSVSMRPGNAYTVGSSLCVPGLISLTMSSTDSRLEWFEDYNPCPIGLYMTYSPA